MIDLELICSMQVYLTHHSTDFEKSDQVRNREQQ